MITKPRKPARLPGRWHQMPLVALEHIYSRLSIKERHQASQVCPLWYQCFYSSRPWSTFYLTDASFTKRKFNYYLGYQRILDPYKTHMFLYKFARAVRRLVIEPMGNFFNLYEFMNILANYTKFYDYPYENLKTFDFTFGCHLALAESAVSGEGGLMSTSDNNNRHHGGEHNWSRDSVFGTGGKVLEALKKLMYELHNLRHLALRNLLLDKNEAERLLDGVVANCHDQLETLVLINCCKVSYAFIHVGVFVRLRVLVLSPQHLSEDVLQLLADVHTLQDLYLVQTDETKNVQTLQSNTWKAFHATNSNIKVHLGLVRKNRIITDTSVCVVSFTYLFEHSISNSFSQDLIKPKARISSVIYDTCYISMESAGLWDISRLYSDHLECVAFYGMPKYYHSRAYPQRVDASLVSSIDSFQ